MENSTKNASDYVLETAIALAPIALGYFSGISYLDSLLSNFGLSIYEFDVSIANIAAHSFNIITNYFFIIPLLCIFFSILLISILLSLNGKNHKNQNRTVTTTFSFLIFLLLIFAIRVAAEDAASKKTEKLWNGDTTKSFLLKEFSADLFNLGKRQKLRLQSCIQQRNIISLFSTKERVYSACINGNEGFVFTLDTVNRKYVNAQYIIKINE
ncbi:hypothetical protein [Roseibium sp. LAB1]